MVIHHLHASVLDKLKQYSQYVFCLSMSAPAQNAFDITSYQAFWLHCTAFVRSLHGSSCCGNDLVQRKSLVDDATLQHICMYHILVLCKPSVLLASLPYHSSIQFNSHFAESVAE